MNTLLVPCADCGITVLEPRQITWRDVLGVNMAAKHPTGEIASVTQLVNELEGIVGPSLKAEAGHHYWRYWFRGHSDSGWVLAPGVFRTGFVADEKNRLTKERHLFQDFRVHSAGLRTGSEADIDIYFLQQHYGIPTRLLDWSTSALVALYFATNEHSGKDGRVYMIDALRFRAPSGIATSRRPSIMEAIKLISAWDDTQNFPHNIVPIRPDRFDGRIGLQMSCFTLHSKKDSSNDGILTEADNPTLRAFKIPQARKQQINNELSLLGINAFTIYGDLQHLSMWLRDAYPKY